MRQVVFPSLELEKVLGEHPDVSAVEVDSASIDHGGVSACAFVEIWGAIDVDLESLKRWADVRLNGDGLVYEIKVVEKLPLHSSANTEQPK